MSAVYARESNVHGPHGGSFLYKEHICNIIAQWKRSVFRPLYGTLSCRFSYFILLEEKEMNGSFEWITLGNRGTQGPPGHASTGPKRALASFVSYSGKVHAIIALKTEDEDDRIAA